MNIQDIVDLAISAAQKKYGPSNHHMSILPILYHPEGPYIGYEKINKIQIVINDSCKGNLSQAFYQISHEALHTLSPVTRDVVTVLEEGIATHFSHEFTKAKTGDEWNPAPEDVKYVNARDRVIELITLVPDALEQIRYKFGGFSPLDANELAKMFQNVNSGLLKELSLPFN
ncbi:hypothetical protein [Shewanella vaxholmensis]|uniref:IrrE N-terminal-like domain-containing protein n=1 Tax=Shewanella vaxholmensis TaxID=3063535 RepID=A0ABU9UXT1_9GAMM